MLYTKKIKQLLTHELVLEELQKLITFNQNTWLKNYIDTNTYLV